MHRKRVISFVERYKLFEQRVEFGSCFECQNDTDDQNVMLRRSGENGKGQAWLYVAGEFATIKRTDGAGPMHV